VPSAARQNRIVWFGGDSIERRGGLAIPAMAAPS
jgi:hypothetical protein